MIWNCYRIAALLLLALLLSAAPAIAHTEDDSAAASITLDERVGAKLPPDLIFRDETGQAVRLGDLLDRPTIILPVYYGCANVCYSLQWNLAATLPKLGSRAGQDYRVISISFDEHEGAPLAAKFKRIYLASLPASFPKSGWRFLTGDAANISAFTEAIGYRFQRRGNDFIHPVASLVVSADGRVVRYLYGAAFLPKDLALALVEAKSGTAGVTVRKMVEYCFSFDPGKKTYVFNLLKVSATVVILCTGGFLAFLILGGKKRKKDL